MEAWWIRYENSPSGTEFNFEKTKGLFINPSFFPSHAAALYVWKRQRCIVEINYKQYTYRTLGKRGFDNAHAVGFFFRRKILSYFHVYNVQVCVEDGNCASKK